VSVPNCGAFTGSSKVDGLKGIIFDCDGVLVDSKEANTTFYNMIREHFGYAPMSAAQESYVHSHAVNESVAHIVPPEQLDEAWQFVKNLNYRDVLPRLSLEPGLVDFLDTLRGCGYHLGILTNRTTTMNLLLRWFNISMFFTPVITARLVRPKPSPEGLFRVLRQWRMEPADVAYIGDSGVDAECARLAGVRFWAYRNASLPADMLVHDFWSLRNCFLRLHKDNCGIKAS
jgi:HAD superfamily hydrolase (TIGR01549 family)